LLIIFLNRLSAAVNCFKAPTPESIKSLLEVVKRIYEYDTNGTGKEKIIINNIDPLDIYFDVGSDELVDAEED